MPERGGGGLFSFDGGQAALLVDGLLTRVARGRGALDVAMAERLADMATGANVLRLGWSGTGDYAREVLGIAPRTAQQMIRTARELRARPLLREAVRRGDVSSRRAVAVLPLAVGDEEGAWVERARVMTVRELEGAAKSGGAAAAADERWEEFSATVSEATRSRLDQALDLAGRMIGTTSPRWQRLEVICQEYLGDHPAEAGDPRLDDEGAGCEPIDDDWLDQVKAGLEEEYDRWSFLEDVEPVGAPGVPDGPSDPWRIDAALRELVSMRGRWDELVGHLGLVIQTARTWKAMGFANFSHYCEERLGLSARAVEQRVWLERKMYDLPELRDALRSGRLTYEKARIVAAEADSLSIEAAIEYAATRTCIALRREVEATQDAQMRAQGGLVLPMPESVARLLDDAFRAVRVASPSPLGADECLFRIADHFVSTWEHELEHRPTPARRAVTRDRGLCQVPGCSRPACHAHHVQFRSRGGSDDTSNLVGVCVVHHLACIHRGWVRVSGIAPDDLEWEMGERAA